MRRLIDGSDGDVTVSVSDTKIMFTSGRAQLTSKLIDGSFPDYARVIPKGNDKAMIIDNRVAIVGAAETTELGKIPTLSQIGLHADAALNALADSYDRATQAQAARFIREAKLAARINHPGVVTVHDAGEDDAAIAVPGAHRSSVSATPHRSASQAGSAAPTHRKIYGYSPNWGDFETCACPEAGGFSHGTMVAQAIAGRLPDLQDL